MDRAGPISARLRAAERWRRCPSEQQLPLLDLTAPDPAPRRGPVKPRRQPRPRLAVAPAPVRRVPGELRAVPDGVRHQTRQISVRIEQLPDGMLKLSQPKASGWVGVARTPVELARAVAQAFREAQIGAYSEWKGAIYDDPDAPKYRRHKPIARSSRRSDVYDCRLWRVDPDRDGVWVSPRGLRFAEDRQVVQRVIAQRVAQGLPPRPDAHNAQERVQEETA